MIPAVAPRYGGPSQAVIELCRALENKQVEAEICATDADGPARLPVELGKMVNYRGVRCHFFPHGWSESFKFSRSMGHWLDENVGAYDVLHIHAVFAHATYAAARAARRTAMPYIVRPLGTLEPWSMSQKPVRKRIAWRFLFRDVLEQAELIHYTTEQEREFTEHSLALDRGIVIPNGVDESLLDVCPTGQFRKAHDIPADAPFLLTLSRLHPKKGLDLLLKVFSALKSQGQLAAWHLVVAGDGQAEYVRRLRELVRGTSAEAFVHWTGWLDGESKSAALAEADLFVLSSFQENFGIGAVEAMACGTPVLLSRQVGLAPDILAKRAGWIVNLDAAGLANGLADAVRDPDELSERGAAARALVRERFTWPRIAEECVGMYKKILSQRKQSVVYHEPVADCR